MAELMAALPSLSALLLVILLGVVAATTSDGGSSEVDFIIVGAGTAGCVITSRLCTAFPGARFALLEQGAPRTFEQELIVRSIRLVDRFYGPFFVPGVSRIHLSEPNPVLFNTTSNQFGRQASMVEGMTVGGSSNIAFQWEHPSSVEDYGIDGFNSQTAGMYFRRAENVIRPAVPPESLQQIYSQEGLDAFGNVGFDVLERSPDFPYDPAVDGENIIYKNKLTVGEDGRRRDSYTEYLKPAMMGACQDNLRLIQDATVTRLRFDQDDPKKVVGVEYVPTTTQDTSETRVLTARKEVFLTAGPFGSPRLLMLSGIGPKDVLEARGVENVVADLPVGQMTQTRPVSGALGLYTGQPLAPVNNSTEYLSDEARETFLSGQGGPLGREYTFSIGKLGDLGYHSHTFISPVFFNELMNLPVLITACNLNSVSYGNVTIVNNEPFTPLELYTNILNEPQDFAGMIQCVGILNQVVKEGFTPDFGMTSLIPESLPIENYVSANTVTAYHFVGGSATGSVVDGASFKVLGGVQKLRVVDASVLPTLPKSAGPLTSVYAIAEFAAEKIVQEYKGVFAGKKNKKSKKTKDAKTEKKEKKEKKGKK